MFVKEGKGVREVRHLKEFPHPVRELQKQQTTNDLLFVQKHSLPYQFKKHKD